ncbi:hypothetical protein BB561_002190 [Smittium simulii]|uniref:Uncharacterized protein n=1 Tax=Smittium simulii TaxID=133385 RepID=A0A2T9YRE5_9FUNG|nr:hypothetical protein BB561_002190 [Smittium simulii]
METAHISLKPGVSCAILYWQDVIKENSLKLEHTAHLLSQKISASDPILDFQQNSLDSAPRPLDSISFSKKDPLADPKSVSHVIQLKSIDSNKPPPDSANDDADSLDEESDNDTPKPEDLLPQYLPDAIANDPFFARLLRNAEQYSEPKAVKKPVKRKIRDPEDDYDVQDPFIDDSELTFMDGHVHSRAYSSRKKRVVLGYSKDSNSQIDSTQSSCTNIQQEEGKVILDLELFDRASADDFFVYFGELEEFEEETAETQLSSSVLDKPQAAIVDPAKVPLRPKQTSPEKKDNSLANEVINLTAEKKQKSLQPNPQKSSNNLPKHQQIIKNIPMTPELKSCIKKLEDQVKTGIIVNKGHFPSPLKEPMRNVLISAIQLNLEYENVLLNVYPLPLKFKHNSTQSGAIKSANSVDQFSTEATLDKSISNTNEVLLDNQIMMWESATDLIDINSELKFCWTQTLRHLLYQFVKVYLETHGVLLNPLASILTTEERAKQQRLRKDAYNRILKIWPDNKMTTTILSREYSYRRSLIVAKLRKSLGTSSNKSNNLLESRPVANTAASISAKKNESQKSISTIELTKAQNELDNRKEKTITANPEAVSVKRPPGNNLNKKKPNAGLTLYEDMISKDNENSRNLAEKAGKKGKSSPAQTFSTVHPTIIPIEKFHNMLGLKSNKPGGKNTLEDLIAKSGSAMFLEK